MELICLSAAIVAPIPGLPYSLSGECAKFAARFSVVQCVCPRCVSMGKAELHDNLLATFQKLPVPKNTVQRRDILRLVPGSIDDERRAARIGLLTYHIISKPANVLTVIGHLNIRKSLLRQDVITDSEAASFFRDQDSGPVAVVDSQSTVGCDIECRDIRRLRRHFSS